MNEDPKDVLSKLEKTVADLETEKKTDIDRKIKEKEEAIKVAEQMKDLKNLNAKLNTDLEALKEDSKHIKDTIEKDRQERKVIFDITQYNKQSAKPEEKFSFARLFKAISYHNMSLAPYEVKALGEATGSAGGFLVPEEYITDIKERIMAKSIVRSLGVTTYPMIGDTLNVPKITGGATAYWLAENTSITSTDPTFGQLVLQAKLLAARLILSNQLIADSNPAVESVVKRDTAKVIALAEDVAFIQGTGTGAQPTGVLNTSGIASTELGSGNGATPTFDDIYNALYQVELANGLASGWVIHPRTKNTLRKIKASGSGEYIYNVAPSVKEPDTLVGLPVKLTTQIPISLTVGTSSDCSYLLVGQWDEAVIGERAGMEFAATNEGGTAFEYYQTWIRVIERVDFGLRTPEVFCKVTGIRP